MLRRTKNFFQGSTDKSSSTIFVPLTSNQEKEYTAKLSEEMSGSLFLYALNAISNTISYGVAKKIAKNGS